MKKKILTLAMLTFLCFASLSPTQLSARTRVPTATKNLNNVGSSKFTLDFDAKETLYSNFKYYPCEWNDGTASIELRMDNGDEACIRVVLYDATEGEKVETLYTSDEDYDNEFCNLDPDDKYYFIFKNCSSYDCSVYVRIF